MYTGLNRSSKTLQQCKHERVITQYRLRVGGLHESRIWIQFSVVGVLSGASFGVFRLKDVLIFPHKHRQVFLATPHGDK